MHEGRRLKKLLILFFAVGVFLPARFIFKHTDLQYETNIRSAFKKTQNLIKIGEFTTNTVQDLKLEELNQIAMRAPELKTSSNLAIEIISKQNFQAIK